MRLVSQIPDERARHAVQLLVDGTEGYYRDLPSQLRSPFDLAFFVEVLAETVATLRSVLNGSNDRPLGGNDPEDIARSRPVPEPEGDKLLETIRGTQARNFIGALQDEKVQGCLLALKVGALWRQQAGWVDATGKACPHSLPEFPFDVLFMCMAVEDALRPGRPARVELEKP